MNRDGHRYSDEYLSGTYHPEETRRYLIAERQAKLRDELESLDDFALRTIARRGGGRMLQDMSAVVLQARCGGEVVS